ncbi:MAG: hypothetical protein WBP75_13845 [Candidatus Cybelea sp.]
MKLSSLLRGTLATSALAATLAACDRTQMLAAAPPAPAGQLRSWMASDAGQQPLVYAGGDVASYVFSLRSGKLVGTIAETSFGTCSDSNGDVFFTQVKRVVEYAHGGLTPIASFAIPGTAYSCSVDPTSGDLAAVVFCLKKCGDEVVVLQPAGPRRIYRDRRLDSLLFCAYDASGNLFVDGYNGTQFGLTELPKGARHFASVTLNKTIRFGAQVQWDGQDLAVQTSEFPRIYQVSVSGSAAKIVHTIKLSGVGNRATQAWIQDGKIAVPTGQQSKRPDEIFFWDYPAGGKPIKEFEHFIGRGHQMIDGVTFSRAPG